MVGCRKDRQSCSAGVYFRAKRALAKAFEVGVQFRASRPLQAPVLERGDTRVMRFIASLADQYVYVVEAFHWIESFFP